MEQEAPLEPGESETPRSEASYTSEAPLSPTVPEGMEEDSNLEQKAAVGSVVHLLSTTFKEVFARTDIESDTEEAPEDEPPAEEVKKTKKREPRLNEDGEPIDDDDEEWSSDEEGEEKKEEQNPDSEPLGEEPPSSELGGDPDQSPDLLADPDPEPEPEPEEERPWHLVRFDEIKSRLKMQHSQAENLISYLSQQHKHAIIEDVKSEHSLKRMGLIQSAHVPIPYSTLDLNEMSSPDDPFGEFAQNLVGARHLVQANHERLLRVSGTLPMSALKSRTERKVRLEDVTKKPGYLKQTANNTKRSELIMTNSHAPHGKKFDFENTTTTVKFNLEPQPPTPPKPARTALDLDLAPHVEYNTHSEKPPELEFVAPVDGKTIKTVDPNRLVGTGTEPPAKPKPEVRLEGEQWDLDMQVLRNMDQKLKYLKNPRYDKRAINNTRVLTRPLATEADLQEGAFTGAPKFKFPDGDHNFMIAQPSVVEFTEYQVDGVYEKALYIRNATAISRGITILPSTSQFFSFTKIEYPGESKGHGTLAPGMAVKIIVRFQPDSLANYEDLVTCVSEGGKFQVKLWAHRPPPKLSIPLDFPVGACLVGDAKRVQFECRNDGGKGRFRLMLEEEWPVPPKAHSQIPTLEMKPFKMYPTHFDLDHGDSVTLHVDYSPVELGHHKRKFIIVCDNCHVTTYSLNGSSESVFLRVSNVNDVPLEDVAVNPLSLQPKFVDFENIPCGDICERRVSIRNDTPIDLNFRWDFRDIVSKKLQKVEGWGGRPRSRQLCQMGSRRAVGSRGNGVLKGTEEYNDDPRGFEIEPRYGVFSANSDTTFTVRFSAGQMPTIAEVENVLVVEGVPPSAIPSEDQAGLLRNLAEHGYGKYLRMQAWFKAMDVDGGGTIDKDELKAKLQEIGLDSHSRAVRECLEIVDTDGDGEITITEFMDGIPNDLQAAIERNLDTMDIAEVQDAIRREVDCLGFVLRGSSSYIKFGVDPVALSFPGKLTAGVIYTKQVIVKNGAGIPSEFEFGTPYYDDNDGVISSGRPHEVPDMNDYLVEINPKAGLIPPFGSISSTVTFSAKPEGLVGLSLPVNVKGSNPNLSSSIIRLSADVIGPRLRIEQSEVDFGLVAVGGNKEFTVTFRNEGDVPLAWACLYLSKSDALDEKVMALSSKLSTTPGKSAYGRKTTRGMSLMSSASSFSMGGSSMGSGNSPNSFKIDSPHCNLTFSPHDGILGPKETGKVIINCAAGMLPQRLRATLAFLVSDDSKEHDYETQYVGVRGEVQCPKVYLDTTQINLGITYTDVPVVRYVTMTNLSNLDTKFKWERPAGVSPSFNVEFEPDSGSLSSKQVLKCKVTYTAKLPGAIDDLYRCRIFGMNMNIGFNLKTISKGVVVGYERVEDGNEIPEPLCPPDAPQFIGDPEDVPQPGLPPKMHVKGDVALFQRRTMRFIIRNFSAVPAKFSINPRKYLPADIDGDDFGFSQTRGSSSLGGSTKGGQRKKKPILGNAHEKAGVFQTKNGQEHTRARIEYEEDLQILGGGLGFAVDVWPKEGILTPWGITLVTVNTFNNMPGTYKDEIHCQITGAPITRLDFRSLVVGCPLSLKTTSLGLDTVSGPLAKMKFGEVALNCKPLTRTICIKNSGPIDSLVRFSIREPADDTVDNRVVALTFDENEDASSADPFKIKLGLYEKPKFESPFDIHPQAMKIPKHGEKNFTITLREVVADEQIGDKKLWRKLMNVLMVADAQWLHPKPLPSLMESSSLDSLSSKTGTASSSRRKTARHGDDAGGLERETNGAVKLGVEAMAVSPFLFLDKRRHGEKNAISEVDDKDVDVKQVVKISISAMEYKEYKETGELPDAMEQTFLLTNQLSISQDLALTCQGPFVLESAKTMSLPHPSYKNPSSEEWNTDRGRLFRLPPLESVEVSVSFKPKVTPLSDGSRDDVDESRDMKLDAQGRLKIKFNTGQTQFVELKGELLRPTVAVQPSDYHYGTVHVEEEQDIIVYVCNPTLVTANYKITHIPEIKPKRKRMILDPDNELNKAHTDDPSVFIFSEYEGSQAGPTLPLPSSGYCLPDDKNRKKHAPVFEKTSMSLTWRGEESDLEFGEKLRKVNTINPRNPRAITVKFKPGLDKRYRSRFRFEVEEGLGFDVLLTGRGTYIEHGKRFAPPHV
ncbi:hypothetical protein TrVE_jg7849 [Triparma verrucosa]|uniref:EF-hand domain-containing protein n=1 Tax=Triparma verrucosa TaxID=1606542 RepID=A0A9W7BZA6_9STRA|nr:hypothetical protein TrVE_jg7849 [Triparma verrucosa]